MLPFLVCSTNGGFEGFPVASPAIASDVTVVSIHSFVPDDAIAECCASVGRLKEADVSPVVKAETGACSRPFCIIYS